MNINPNAKRILCFGDSNTRGYISGTNHERYDVTKRWTGILQTTLGNNFDIIEEGLNSRTLISDDDRPGKEGKNGYNYLIPCLDTHNPIDTIIIMLGTNELKDKFHRTIQEIGDIFEEKYIKQILERKYELQPYIPKVIILGLPPIDETKEYSKQRFLGINTIINKVNETYKKIALKNNVIYISTSSLSSGPDGVHLTEESHKILGTLLAQKIKEII